MALLLWYRPKLVLLSHFVAFMSVLILLRGSAECLSYCSRPADTFYNLAVHMSEALVEQRNITTNLQGALNEQQRALRGWKDTSEKLQGAWEREKPELMKNFLALLRSVISRPSSNVL